MEIRGPGIHRNHTGCFDSVPSAACARDGTPLNMTSLWFVGKFGAGMVERAAPSRVSWCAPLKKRARSDTLHLFAAPRTLFCQQTG